VSSPSKWNVSSPQGVPNGRRVLIVCKGNVCRSPFAEIVLQELGSGTVEARSRGVRSWHEGRPANAEAVKVSAEFGYDLRNHVAHQIVLEDVTWAQDVLAVDLETLNALVDGFGPACEGKVRLFLSDGSDLVDPYKQDHEVFTSVFAIVEQRIKDYLASL
jgi:protein-tyrosine phosphatase